MCLHVFHKISVCSTCNVCSKKKSEKHFELLVPGAKLYICAESTIEKVNSSAQAIRIHKPDSVQTEGNFWFICLLKFPSAGNSTTRVREGLNFIIKQLVNSKRRLFRSSQETHCHGTELGATLRLLVRSRASEANANSRGVNSRTVPL